MIPKQRNCPLCEGSLRRFNSQRREYWCGCVVLRQTGKIITKCEKPFNGNGK